MGKSNTYNKTWEVKYLTKDGSTIIEDVVLSRASDRFDVTKELKKRSASDEKDNIGEIISITEVKGKGNETDKYHWFVLDTKANKIVNAFEKDDKNSAQDLIDEISLDNEDYKIIARRTMESMGLDYKYENGGSVSDFINQSIDLKRKHFSSGMSKGDLMNMAYGESYSNVDSALPMGLLESEGISSDERWHYVMDYNDNSFGKLTDLFEKISEKNPSVEVYNEEFNSLGVMPINEASKKFIGQNVMFSPRAIASSTFGKGGEVTWIDTDTYSQRRRSLDSNIDGGVKIWENYKNIYDQESVGAFAHRVDGKYIGDYYLFTLDDYDRDFYAHLPLKPNEVLFRTETERGRISKSLPLVKINIENGRVYFMSMDNDIHSDEDDKNPKFNKASVDVIFLTLDKKIKSYNQGLISYEDISTYANGGEVESYSEWKKRNGITVEKRGAKEVAIDENGFELVSAGNKLELSKKLKNLYMFSKYENTPKETMYANGGELTRDGFKLGELVYDTTNKRYGTIIGIYDTEKYEVRLDSDGMQPTESLRKLGDKEDKGTKKQLFEAVSSIERLRTLYPENNYPQLINNPFYANGGSVDLHRGKVSKNGSLVIYTDSKGKPHTIDGSSMTAQEYVAGLVNGYTSHFKSQRKRLEHIEETGEDVGNVFAYGGTLFGGEDSDGKNGYIAFYKGRQEEVYADTSLKARDKAVKLFKAKKPYEVIVVLAEKDGEQVTHAPMFADGGDINDVAEAIFYNNSKKGKISTELGEKTLQGLTAMIENDNYTPEEIASAIFNSNDKNGKIETSFGSKSYGGILAMIVHSRSGKLKYHNLGQYADGGSTYGISIGEYDANIGNVANLHNYGTYWHSNINANKETIGKIDRFLSTEMENTEDAYKKHQEARQLKDKLWAENLHLMDNFGGSDGYKTWVDNYDEAHDLPFANGGEIGSEVEVELTDGKIIKGKIEKLNPLKIRTDDTSTQVIPNAIIKNIKGGSTYQGGGEIESVAKAIFEPNDIKGKIETSMGKKTLKGLENMIEDNDAYDIYVALKPNFEGKGDGLIATNYGDKNMKGLIAMIENAKGGSTYQGGGDIGGDHIGKIIQMKKTADWFKVITAKNEGNLYGKKKPTYTIVDISKLKNGKIIANINHSELEGFNEWLSNKEIVSSLPIKYQQAFDKLVDEYNVYADGGSIYQGGGEIEYSIQTENEEEHFDNEDEAREFWENLSEEERKSGQFFSKEWEDGEEGEVIILGGKFSTYQGGGEIESWIYKWGSWEAKISKHPRRKEYRWSVYDVDGNDTYDFNNDLDVELETPLEAENNMFRNIQERIGHTPEKQISSSTYQGGGEIEKQAIYEWNTMDRFVRADFLDEIDEDLDLGESRFEMKAYKYDDLPKNVQEEVVKRLGYDSSGSTYAEGGEIIEIDKYDVPYNKWTDISDDDFGVMFVYSTKNWTVIYGDHWDNNGFMVRTDKDPYYLESSGGEVEKPFKTLTEAKRFAHKLVESKVASTYAEGGEIEIYSPAKKGNPFMDLVPDIATKEGAEEMWKNVKASWKNSSIDEVIKEMKEFSEEDRERLENEIVNRETIYPYIFSKADLERYKEEVGVTNVNGKDVFAYGGMLDSVKVSACLNDGKISCEDLEKICGHKPNYPKQTVGRMEFEKCFLSPYYKVVKN
jgi:hypothetical protein